MDGNAKLVKDSEIVEDLDGGWGGKFGPVSAKNPCKPLTWSYKAIIYTATTTDSYTATIPAKNTAASATMVTMSAAVSTIWELKQGKFISRGQQ